MVTKAAIQEFLAQRKIAIIGVSRDTKQFANIVYRLLKERGYTVYPVNPYAENVEGDRCYPSAKVLPEKVDSAVIMLPPEKVLAVLSDIADVGINYVWIQRHSETEQSIQFCKDHNIKVVYGECIIMFLEPVAFPHRFHRWIKKVSGGFSKEN